MKPNRKTSHQTLRYFWNHTKRHPYMFGSIFLCLFIGVVVNDIIVPFFYKELIDVMSENTGEKSIVVSSLITIILSISGLYVVGDILGWRLGSYINANFQTRVIKNITDDCFAKLHQHSFGFFSNHFAGSLVAKHKRMYQHFEVIADVFTWEIFPNVLRVGFSIGVLAFIAPIFAILLSIWIVFYIGITWAFSLWKMKYDLKAATYDSKITGETADAITNAVPIKLFARLKYECQKFFATTDSKRKIQRFQWNLGELNSLFAGMSMIAVEFGMMYFAIKLWSTGDISIGVIVLVQSYLFVIIKNLWDFGRTVQRLYQSLSETAEMTEILNLPAEVSDPQKPEPCRITSGNIRFEHVDFSYESEDNVFTDLNIKIAAGEKIGIVGESGAGKTTITKLLLRFFDISSGKILIDGQNISHIRQDDLRTNIAFVPQEPILFHRTLRDNIRYGKLEASEEEIIQAAKNAHAHEFILHCSDQYNTFVGERGIKLSGGEKQRVAIARAMLKDAPILILDEATSSLDSKAEVLIQDALEKLMKNRTTLVIAHRLSTLRKMDRILVFEKGTISEMGSHDELLEKKGKYAELWSHQVGGFLVE